MMKAKWFEQYGSKQEYKEACESKKKVHEEIGNISHINNLNKI